MMAIRADLGGGLESQQWIVNAYLLTLGPPVSAGGVLYLIATVNESPGLLLEVLPGTTIFAVGLAIVVAPLTETVLSDADEHDAGIASGVNNAVARVGDDGGDDSGPLSATRTASGAGARSVTAEP
jgi:hypothetical protein